MEKVFQSAFSVACFALILSCGAAVQPQVTNKPDSAAPTATAVAGNACTEDKECITGEVCDPDAKKCSPTCATNDDCKAPLKCVDAKDKQYCGTKKTECEEDVDCDAGKICTDEGACKTPRCPGDHCPTGYACFQNACVQQQTTNTCRVAADCNAVATCKPDKCDCVANKCQQKAVAITCTAQNASTVCKADEFCDNGACKSLTTKTCAKDTDCPALYYCPPSQVPGSPQTCAPGCKDNSECTSGNKCDLQGSHQCVPPGSLVMPPCTGDEDCEPGCEAAFAADSNYVSTKLCDYRLSDALTGHGVCRDRCSQAAYFIGNPFDLGLPYTPGVTCADATYSCEAVNKIGSPMVSPDKTSSCGGGVIGGYSACK
jgi:hypothetical protein